MPYILDRVLIWPHNECKTLFFVIDFLMSWVVIGKLYLNIFYLSIKPVCCQNEVSFGLALAIHWQRECECVLVLQWPNRLSL